MDQAKFRIVINWVGQQVFDVDAANANEAELKAVKMACYESVRMKPTITVQQTTVHRHVDPRVVAVVASAR